MLMHRIVNWAILFLFAYSFAAVLTASVFTSVPQLLGLLGSRTFPATTLPMRSPETSPIRYATYLGLIAHLENIPSGCEFILCQLTILLQCQTYLVHDGQKAHQLDRNVILTMAVLTDHYTIGRYAARLISLSIPISFQLQIHCQLN